jgi:hypothetical protein
MQAAYDSGDWKIAPDHPWRIIYAHYHADVVDAERMRVDPTRLDPIARLGGATCSTIRDRFDMPTPTLQDWMAAKGT